MTGGGGRGKWVPLSWSWLVGTPVLVLARGGGIPVLGPDWGILSPVPRENLEPETRGTPSPTPGKGGPGPRDQGVRPTPGKGPGTSDQGVPLPLPFPFPFSNPWVN